MKLRQLAKHIPAYQAVRIIERKQTQDEGFFNHYGDDALIQKHGNKTVGVFSVSKNGILEINVWVKQ